MRRIGLVLTAVALCAAPALATEITSISLSPVHTSYTAVDQQISFYNDDEGVPPLSISIFFDDMPTYNNTPGLEVCRASMYGFLYENLTDPGGPTWGRFNNGEVEFYLEDGVDTWHILGNLIGLEVIETGPDTNLFNGSGLFDITFCGLPGGCNWSSEYGSIGSFTFVPEAEWGEIHGWGSDFAGTSLVTWIPDDSGFPEPATCLVLGGLALGLLRRR
jgi:hypothetical protein